MPGFATNPAKFAVAVQLCTDIDTMPVENADKEWSEEESPYQTVGRLLLPPQAARAEARQVSIDEDLSFSPAHSLAAHRPRGSIMRARMDVYEVLGRRHREMNGRPATEPAGIVQIPA